jgi:phosphoribosylglycinamide formyltransferase-1|tara:strand:+ start:477 stop:1121 length:645 start_codon:yes stop_codon:yes gene_type:complete
MKVVVLVSGGGSNLQALIDGQQDGSLPIEIAAVISNRPGVRGLDRARDHGINAELLDHKNFASRDDFDVSLMNLIDGFDAELIVLAGFMRILTPQFTGHYVGRMLNIHPSLLPKYQGLHTHQRALDAADSEHGVSVHFVTAELDGGPIAIQARVPVLLNDDANSLAKRVQVQEHVIYPLAVKWFALQRLTMKDNLAVLDNKVLPNNGYQIDTSF